MTNQETRPRVVFDCMMYLQATANEAEAEKTELHAVIPVEWVKKLSIR